MSTTIELTENVLDDIMDEVGREYRNNRLGYTEMVMHPVTADIFDTLLNYEHEENPIPTNAIKYRWATLKITCDGEYPPGQIILR